jgi:hypothetical protein
MIVWECLRKPNILVIKKLILKTKVTEVILYAVFFITS